MVGAGYEFGELAKRTPSFCQRAMDPGLRRDDGLGVIEVIGSRACSNF
jgi:hypothetical protein